MQLYKIRQFFIFMLAIWFVVSCDDDEIDYNSLYVEIEKLEIKEAVGLANVWKYDYPEITSYVDNKKLNISFPDGRDLQILLPENEIYVAIAPYETYTHECQTHYISSCEAELKKSEFFIKLSDENEVIFMEEVVHSLKNGFIELWLPKDREFETRVIYENKSCEFTLTTYETSRTCITDLKLN